MVSDAWFRFGLPLGSALVLVGFLDTAINLFSAWMDLGGIFVFHVNQATKVDPVAIVWIVIITVYNLSNLGLLWIGGILRGSVSLLIAWIVTTVVCGVIVLGIWIYSMSLGWGDWRSFLSEMYMILTFLLVTGYLLNVTIQCLKPLKDGEPLEPIGKGVRHLLKFYRDDPTLAAKCLLISELVVIAEYVFTRQVLQFAFEGDLAGHEGDTSAGIIAEEYVIRWLRFIISGVGIYFVHKGKVLQLKYWGLIYLGSIIASTGIFIYLLIEWNAEHPLFTIGYYLTFLMSLVYRVWILYTSMQVIQPYISSSSFLTLNENN